MIKGYIGMFGMGKTLNMVYDLIRLMKKGRRVVSNTPIEFIHQGKKIKSDFIRDADRFQQALIYDRNCSFAIDEASVYLPNNYWHKLPPEFIMKFAQARKSRTDFYYTTQGYGHTIKRLRDLTHVVVKCWKQHFLGLKFLPYVFISINYDPQFYGHSSTSEKKARQYTWGRRILYPREYISTFEAYNTFYEVEGSAMVNYQTKPKIKITNQTIYQPIYKVDKPEIIKSLTNDQARIVEPTATRFDNVGFRKIN